MMNKIKIRVVSVLSTLLILCACLDQGELTVTPIEDDYAQISGGDPVKGYYYMNSFKNSKEGMSQLFDYLERHLPLTSGYFSKIIDKKNGVFFEDGGADVKKGVNHNFLIEMTDDGYYKEIITTTDIYVSPYEFHKENKQPYEITHSDKKSIVRMSYSKLDKFFLQHFLNIINFERLRTDEPKGVHTYQLKNEKSQTIEVEIIYHNEPSKGLDNVFTIRFM